MEKMVPIGLTCSVVPLTSHKANQPVTFHTYRANEMDRLFFSHVFFEAVNDIAFRRLKKLVSLPLSIEFILPFQFLAERFERAAQFNVHHVRCGKFPRKGIEQSICLCRIRRLVAGEQPLNSFSSGNRFAGRSKGRRSEAEHAFNLRIVHVAYSFDAFREFRDYPAKLTLGKREPGAHHNFFTFHGTGVGSTAQETPEITFSEKAKTS